MNDDLQSKVDLDPILCLSKFQESKESTLERLRYEFPSHEILLK